MAWICDASWSVRGDQVKPPLVVRQMPPVSEATYMTFGSDGSTAMPLSRPVDDGLPGAWPAEIGEGPIGVQVNPLSGMELEGTSRVSHASSRSRVRSDGRRRVAGRRANSECNHPRRVSLLMVR